ncbi:hypothetical protein OD917_04095 [Flavobacterium sp. SH_e]|uniref:hypothetical protein n=1 Tax=Flavobacterium TaxID=237 RepID=UPI0021E36EA2|nr:hypothetical protein [Flavobacterium sp. SH_e]MCV2484093.1 hypothetical protein [Flavobacterium sp. SH_e]
METTTLKSPKKEIQLINPPGVDITPPEEAAAIGRVGFKKKKSVDILSPYVEAYYDAKKNVLSINAVVYVDHTKVINEVLDYSIFQNTFVDLDGNPQLQFFIVYDMPEELSEDLVIYEIIFTADADNFIGGLSNIKQIQTFLWDVDPVASRGTVTNVQSG